MAKGTRHATPEGSDKQLSVQQHQHQCSAAAAVKHGLSGWQQTYTQRETKVIIENYLLVNAWLLVNPSHTGQ